MDRWLDLLVDRCAVFIDADDDAAWNGACDPRAGDGVVVEVEGVEVERVEEDNGDG